jgi:hypothetical protein
MDIIPSHKARQETVPRLRRVITSRTRHSAMNTTFVDPVTIPLLDRRRVLPAHGPRATHGQFALLQPDYPHHSPQANQATDLLHSLPSNRQHSPLHTLRRDRADNRPGNLPANLQVIRLGNPQGNLVASHRFSPHQIQQILRGNRHPGRVAVLPDSPRQNHRSVRQLNQRRSPPQSPALSRLLTLVPCLVDNPPHVLLVHHRRCPLAVQAYSRRHSLRRRQRKIPRRARPPRLV